MVPPRGGLPTDESAGRQVHDRPEYGTDPPAAVLVEQRAERERRVGICGDEHTSQPDRAAMQLTGSFPPVLKVHRTRTCDATSRQTSPVRVDVVRVAAAWATMAVMTPLSRSVTQLRDAPTISRRPSRPPSRPLSLTAELTVAIVLDDDPTVLAAMAGLFRAHAGWQVVGTGDQRERPH